jgi:hypothetical protein
MTSQRELLQDQFAQALHCTTREEYKQKKTRLLAYLRRLQPEQFKLEGGRKRAFEHMAKLEGITVEEKLEDFALLAYLLQRSFRKVSKPDALAAVSTCGLSDADARLLEKELEELYSTR